MTNNVVVTSGCVGDLLLELAPSGKIINNTVVADGLMPMPRGAASQIDGYW